MSDYAVSLLKKMLEIYSPSGQEDELSSFLLAETKKLGFDSRRDDAGNVIMEFGQGSPRILMCGHMDTVPGNLETRREDTKIFGRGAVDAKSSLAAMIVAASKLRDRFPGQLLLLGVVDEEGRGTGMKNFIQSDSLDLDYAVFGEPTNTENIAIGYKGLLHLTLKCATKAGHSAAPWVSDNAIEKGMELWNLLKRRFMDSREDKSHFHSVTASLTSMTGGGSTNVIPSECRLTLDVRVPPELNTEEVLTNARETIRSYLNDNPSVMIDLEVADQINACLMNADSMLAQAFSWTIRRVRRKNPIFLKKTGTSDMNLLASRIRIPMVAYGPGDSRLDHTIEEQVSIQDFLAAAEIYEQALNRLITLHNEKHMRVTS